MMLKKNIQEILRRASPWDQAKRIGSQYLPSGDPTKIYNQINEKLEKLGLFIVPVGELEGFCKDIGGHGPKWVNKVMELDLLKDSKLEEAREFVRKILF